MVLLESISYLTKDIIKGDVSDNHVCVCVCVYLYVHVCDILTTR